MSIERYLAGIERFELQLFQMLNSLKVSTLKESRTAYNTRYISLCAVGILSSLSVLFRLIIQALKSFILSRVSEKVEAQSNTNTASPISSQRKGEVTIPEPFGGMEIIIQKEIDVLKFRLKEDLETFVATASASSYFTSKDGVEVITLPSSERLPPVAVAVRTTGGKVKQSKLIFQSSRNLGVKVFRKFGMDEIPVKPTENINLNTDRVMIGDISIRFNTLIIGRSASSP
jgi:hypothetical protein